MYSTVADKWCKLRQIHYILKRWCGTQHWHFYLLYFYVHSSVNTSLHLVVIEYFFIVVFIFLLKDLSRFITLNVYIRVIYKDFLFINATQVNNLGEN